MTTYQAPVQDTFFSLLEVLDFPAHYAALTPEAQLDASTLQALLEAVAKFAEGVLAPLNAPADAQSAVWHDGQVRAPDGFRAAYRQYVDAGWPALAQSPEWGGQGLPYSLQLAAGEYLQAANQSWCMYMMLNDGAIKTLLAGAAREQLQTFLPKLVSGEWLATMCLTESHAGSDLGLLHTRAEPVGDPAAKRYRITGNKIFISSGEHDLAPNIVHLVLARLPGAPSGVRGISLFVVPKFMPAPDGTPGVGNAVSCLSIEHKMGLKGSATCAMAFDGAEGWLVGEPHKGLANMFIFINKSRLAVGVQAVAQAQAAYQQSLAYARERLQGRAPGGATRPDLPADPLTAHPDVRRMLLIQKAVAEGGRALVHECARWVDLADHGDAATAERAVLRLALLIPIAKACLSELAFESVDLSIQVLGGHGYVREWGLEQRLRDVRITRIYEGTTGIQGGDLLGRKVLADPRLLAAFTEEIDDWCAQAVPSSRVTALQAAVRTWREVTQEISELAVQDPLVVGAVAVDYLMLSGYVTLGFMWARQAAVAQRAGSDPQRAAAKEVTAQFYFDALLPRLHTHAAVVRGASGVLCTLDPACL
ncbi:acyl-CoA dehydrogenase C-terminal domain-containing protein [Ramlibacter sp. WS9]|uniref:acyl-CoA dehydrogenase C-terminal domain-containing protein n=1 Tax=Ramlibacter sp. WS9 TaxID=1882741 RepID=UPI001142A8FB|nr:acyl-CoA dehydrogenase C-terminal domain-containing protein [Ramlibacter sp. WS9]ROZ68749.1 acyl-CoA dehydrogenase [Ramlibacter sp. WS9]